jgi:ParB family chromosome partitioning protein
MLLKELNLKKQHQMSSKKSALGKGLSALLENSNTDITIKTDRDVEDSFVLSSIARIRLVNIATNPFQPRTHFEKDALTELSQSIKEHGIIQPITVRKIGKGKFQIISGERRFKAAEIIGLDEIPAYIRIADDQSMLEMAIVENVQREDLNAIEIGLSYQRLIDECNLTQEMLSNKIGKNRSTISNYLRLLHLPDEIQAGIRDQKISMGHARALLAIKDTTEMLAAYNEILKHDLSVRKTEKLAREKKSGNVIPSALSRYEKRIQSELSHHYSSNIKIKKSNKGDGKIVIPFNDENDLNRLLDLLDK